MSLESWELLSYVVTVIGLPFAIYLFIHEQRKERDNEEQETYQLLSDSYTDFLKLVLENPDLKLRSSGRTEGLTPEQRERMLVLFDILVSLFERAYLLVYEPRMNPQQLRRWNSWEDYMREWCRREDFRDALPGLLSGEDSDFADYIRRLAGEEGAKAAASAKVGKRDGP
ncbi:hypothetical protein [Calidithermus chliarophilus]|uniref:hypothetical protein n=1 Tax=Calidithermus chliarophilus TaxID=52023 RepID=UPI000411A8C5|nr:hypothetical protein [Calidithermus chliarophilus]